MAKLKLYERAKLHAVRCGYYELSDDFSQWLALKHLEGKSQHQTVTQSFIDFLRQEFGRVGSMRHSHLRNYAELIGNEVPTLYGDKRDIPRIKKIVRIKKRRYWKMLSRGPRGVIG